MENSTKQQLELADLNRQAFESVLMLGCEAALAGTKLMAVPLKDVKKDNNGIPVTEIVFREKGSPNGLACSVSIEPFWRAYRAGLDLDSIVKAICKKGMENALPEQLHGIESKIPDPEFAMKHVTFHVMNRASNEKLLEDSVFCELEDLVAVVYLDLGDVGDGSRASVRVTQNMLSMWKLTGNEVLSQAQKNLDDSPFLVQNMADVLRDLQIGDEMLQNMFPVGTSPLWVISNPQKLGAANALASKKILLKAQEIIGEDFYILPSSKHELLCVPKSEDFKISDLEQMVHDVNRTCLGAEDLLSDRVYEFDSVSKKVRIASDRTITPNQPEFKSKSHVR